MLNKEQILGAEDDSIITVEVPEWKGSVCIKLMSGKDRDSLEDELYSVLDTGKVQYNRKNARSKMLVRCLVDGKGKRLFTDAEVEELAEKSSAVIVRLYDIATKHNELSDKDIAELEKK